MIKFYIRHSENIYTFQNAKHYIKIFNTVFKTCEKVLRLNTSESKKSFIVEKSFNKTVIGLNFGGHKVVSTLKSGLGKYTFFRVDKFSCLPQ